MKHTTTPTLAPFLLLAVLNSSALAQPQESTTTEQFLDSRTAIVAWASIEQQGDPGATEFFTFMGFRVPNLRTPGESASDELKRLRSLNVTRIVWIYAGKRFLDSTPCIVLMSDAPDDVKSEILKAPLPSGYELQSRDRFVVLGEKLHLEDLTHNDGVPPQWMTQSLNSSDAPIGAICSGSALLAADSGFRLLKFASTRERDIELAAATVKIDHVQFMSSDFPRGTSLRIFTKRPDDAKDIADLLTSEFSNGPAADTLDCHPVINGRDISIPFSEADQVLRLLSRIFRLPSMNRTASLTERLRKIAVALHNFHDNYDEFPPQSIVSNDGKRLLSWRVRILPFLGEGDLFSRFHLNEPWDSDWNKTLIADMPDIFKPVDTVDAPPGCTDLLAPLTDDSLFGRRGFPCRISDVSDGVSNTLMIVSVPANRTVIWTKPEDLLIDPNSPLDSLFTGDADSIWCCLADTSVRSLSKTLPVETLRALLTIDGKEKESSVPK